LGDIVAYIVIDEDEASLDIITEKLKKQLLEHLAEKGVEVTSETWIPCG
jgi:ABC-type cobalamin transport system ATPase subunit